MLTKEREQEIRRQCDGYNMVSDRMAADLLSEIDRLRDQLSKLCDVKDSVVRDCKSWVNQYDQLKAENERLIKNAAEPIIEAVLEVRKLCERVGKLRETLKDVRAYVNEQECREDEDCDHCLIVHRTIDPALAQDNESAK